MAKVEIVDDGENGNEEVKNAQISELSEEEKRILAGIKEDEKLRHLQDKEAQDEAFIKHVIFMSLPEEVRNNPDKVKLKKIVKGGQITYAKDEESAQKFSDLIENHFTKEVGETKKIDLKKFCDLAQYRKEIGKNDVTISKSQMKSGIPVVWVTYTGNDDLDKIVSDFENPVLNKGKKTKRTTDRFDLKELKKWVEDFKKKEPNPLIAEALKELAKRNSEKPLFHKGQDAKEPTCTICKAQKDLESKEQKSNEIEL